MFGCVNGFLEECVGWFVRKFGVNDVKGFVDVPRPTRGAKGYLQES